MTDITNIIPGGFKGNERKIPKPLEHQIQDAMHDVGIDPPDHIICDGKIHRFKSNLKGSGGHGSKTGWYIIFPDGVPAGKFGCWRGGIEVNFRADIDRDLSQAEEMAYARRLSEAKMRRDEDNEKQRVNVSKTVAKIWEGCTAAENSHPYLARKGIKSHGARVTGDGRLVVPLLDSELNLKSLQYISDDGGKLYHSGGKTGGAFWYLGALDDDGVFYIAEGYATAATIYEETGRPCVIAYSASNLVPVTGTLREKYGAQQKLVIVADNDESGIGQKYADQASAKYGARVVVIPEPGDANDYSQNGNNLIELLEPKKSDWLVQADEFSAKPAPLNWLLKWWIPATGLVMIHGPSGGGKTFIVLDWALAIAASMDERMGEKCRPGTVFYLAGEGHHGLKGRIALWKQHHSIDHLDMFLSRDGCDLNTPEGYQRVTDAIKSTHKTPSLIVVDTLHRFLKGDENSAQDAKTMLDVCGALINEFQCAVILVHHTGVSEEAQHRARGSSSWRGALDTEISVSPGQAENPIEIIQRKSKDAELADPKYCRLDSIAIKGWLDEDGEQITSAVVRQVDASEKKGRKSKKEQERVKLFEAAWSKDKETRDGKPYLTSGGFRDYLINTEGKSDATADQYSYKNPSKGPFKILIADGIIEPFEYGWIMVNETHISSTNLIEESSD